MGRDWKSTWVAIWGKTDREYTEGSEGCHIVPVLHHEGRDRRIA